MPDLDSLTPEQLEALMDSGTLAPPVEETAPVEVQPDADPTPTPDEGVEVQPEEAPAPEPTPEPEPDWRALAEARAKELEEARAHASRLAGRVGYYENRIKQLSGAEPAPPVEPGVDPLALVRDEVEALKAERQRERIAEIDARAKAEAQERLGLVDEDIALEVVRATVGEFAATVANEFDPARREDAWRRTVEALELRATQAQNARNRERAAATRQAASANLVKAKRAATVSASGAVPAPAPRPRGLQDMTPAELDAWLRSNVT